MTGAPSLYGGPASQRIRTRDVIAAKQRGERWAMLTSYDQYTAGVFDAAGIAVLLVGDSASSNVFGNETTLPVTVDELLPLVRQSCGPPSVHWSSAICRSARTRKAQPRPCGPRCGS
jgi:3-methyl-2-oxobutanoate hydroxymethyltransferase